ncbi:MAG: hypothetical protein LCI00_01840 [Chloroflexi bacterium]|nr:hypothetical protein [Chloroflexota bacterium]MCC6895569.1 hypothetical protein [Anaerolineae bacterium]
MPERRRIPDEPTPQPKKDTGDNQPTQPFLPPELPDDEVTRVQTVQEQTRYMQPVKDVRLNPTPDTTPPEKPKRDTGSLAPRQHVQPVMNEPQKAKREQPSVYPPPARRNVARSRQNSPLRLPLWSVLLMLVGVVGAVACIVVAIVALGGRSAPTAPPEFVVVSAVPSTMPEVTIPSLLATATLPPEFVQSEAGSMMLSGPTLEPIVYTATPTQPPEIAIGSRVVIVGNQGINIRNNYGTESGVVKVANPGEEYVIMDGPRQSNGLNWWQLSDPRSGVTGWAAENDGTTDLYQVITP